METNPKTHGGLRLVLWVMAALAATACDGSGDTGPTGSGGLPGSGGSFATGGVLGGGGFGPGGPACGLLNATEACTCDSGLPGRRTCQASGYSLCECWDPETGDTNLGTASDPPENRRADVAFDWQRTEPVGGSCEAGHYVGAFAGWYASTLAFGGPIPVASIDYPGMPGLEFWMNEADGSGERFEISGGKVRGAANGVFPFEIDFVGDLDCATGEAGGFLLNGWYEVAGIRYYFEGTWNAEYNRLTHSFINGEWEAMEIQNPNDPNAPAPLPTAGGFGTWNASWDPNG